MSRTVIDVAEKGRDDVCVSRLLLFGRRQSIDASVLFRQLHDLGLSK